MSLSVDWSVTPWLITIPKSDLTLETGTKYKLTVDTFWQLLRDFNDSPEAMPLPKLYSRIPATASTPSITEIDGTYYALQFENGTYSVNIIDGNTNIRDVELKNSVSVNTNNTTGFIDPTFLEYSVFDGRVTMDVVNGEAGTGKNAQGFRIGTGKAPVNNLADAKIIAANDGFSTIKVIGNFTFDASDILNAFTMEGENPQKTMITLTEAAIITNCEFFHATISGFLDGGTTVHHCHLGNLYYIDGDVEDCELNLAIITLNSISAEFIRCYSGVSGSQTPIIDLGGSGTTLGIRNYNGGIKLINKTGVDKVSIDLNSGHIILDSTITAGEIICRGVGKITNNSSGTTVDTSGLINPSNIASNVWSDTTGDKVSKNTGLIPATL